MGIDQGHEQNNKLVKIEGGALGILDSQDALMNWVVGGAELSPLLEAFEIGQEVEEDVQIGHSEDTDAHEKQFRKDLLSLKEAFEEVGNPFDEDNELLLHAEILSVSDSVKIAFTTGKDQYEKFVTERLIKTKISLYSPRPKNKLPLFRKKNNVTTSKAKLKTTSLKQDCKLFASLYIACHSREGDLEDFFCHENHAYPPSISEYGKLRPASNKADFLKCLEPYGETKNESPEFTYKIIDGSALVHLTPPEKAKTFGEYSENVFVEKITKLACRVNLQRIDVVFDRYFKTGIKTNTRDKRGNGIEIVVHKSTPIFSYWSKFLLVDKNKEQLFTLLAMDVGNINSDTLFVSTSQEKVISNLPININELSPCNQEEADTFVYSCKKCRSNPRSTNMHMCRRHRRCCISCSFV